MSDSAASASVTLRAALDINNCPHCGEAWVKTVGYVKCWKCQKSPLSAILTAPREPDDTAEQPIDMEAVAAKAAEDGHFWMNFQAIAKAELDRKISKQQELKEARGRKDKNGAYGPGAKPQKCASTALLAGPLTPTPLAPLIYHVSVILHLFREPLFPLPDAASTVEFDRGEAIPNLNQWIRRQIKKHLEFLPGARATQNILIEDLDEKHLGWIALKKGNTCINIGYPWRPTLIVAHLFGYIDTLRGLYSVKNAKILFCFPVIEYDPRNDVEPEHLSETDDLAEEARSRNSSRSRSLGISYKLGRKRLKTLVAKKKIRSTIKVDLLEVWVEEEFINRLEEILSIHTFQFKEKERLELEYGPLPPPSTQPADLDNDSLPPPQLPIIFVPATSISTAAKEGAGDVDEGEGVQVEALKGKKRGKTGKKATGKENDLPIRKSSRGKGKAPA